MSEDFDIKKYLKKLEKTLEEKQLESFFIMVDRTDFKPIKGYDSPKELADMFSKKIQYYVGKRVAHISLYTNPNGLKKNQSIFSIKIVIYKIAESGKFSKDPIDVYGLLINYEPDDFESRKFLIKDVEKFMRLCSDKVINTDTLNGNWYKVIIKRLKKKGIEF